MILAYFLCGLAQPGPVECTTDQVSGSAEMELFTSGSGSEFGLVLQSISLCTISPRQGNGQTPNQSGQDRSEARTGLLY